MMDNEQFLSTAVVLGLLSNAQADRVRQIVGSSGGRKTAAEVAKAEGFLTEAQVGTVLSSMFSRDSEGAGAQMVEGEQCINHPDRLATRACYRCGNPLCPSCGWAEDGYVFCSDECLDIYRDERDAVTAAQDADARRRKALVATITVVVLVAVVAVAGVLWMVVSSHLRTKKGQDLFQKGLQAKGATKVQLIKEALQYKPDIKGAREHITEGYLEASDYVEAEKGAREVLSRSPADIRMKRVLVKALMGQNRVAEAIETYKGMGGAVSVEEVRSFGISLFRDFGVKQEAIEWLQQAFEGAEEDREVAFLLGQYCLEQNDYKKASEYLEKASAPQSGKRIPREVEYVAKPGAISAAAVALARAAFELEDYGTIEEALKRVKDGLRRNVSTTQEVVEVLEYMVPLADDVAIVALTRETDQLSKGGQISGLVRVKGLIAARQGNMEEAASLLEKALAEQTEDKAARRYLVSFYLDQGQTGRARFHFDQLRAAGEKGFNMWLWEARILSGEGHTDEAKRLAEKILAERGDVPQALALAAETSLKKEDFVTAWRRLDRLCQVKPGSWAYLKAFLAAWRIGAEQSAGLYSTKLSTGSAALPRDLQTIIKDLAGVFSGEEDPTKVTDPRLVGRMRQFETPTTNPADHLRKAHAAACVFNYMTGIMAQYDNVALAELDRQFSTAAIPARSPNPYDPAHITAIAEAFKDATVRLLNILAPYAAGDKGFAELVEVMGRDYSLAASGPEKIAVCARTLRNVGYVLYQTAAGGKEAAQQNEGFRLMLARHERESALWKGHDSAVIGLNQAYEALTLAGYHLPNGFTIKDALARLYGEQREKVTDAENALDQMRWQFLYLARLVAALDFVRKVSFVEGALGRRVR